MTTKLKDVLISALIVVIAFGLLHLLLDNPFYFGTSEKELNEIQNEFFISNSNMVFTEQLKFREKLINDYSKNLSNLQSSSMDSLMSLDSLQSKFGIRYLLPTTSSKFKIPLNNYTLDSYLLIGYDTLYIEYAIDENKISSIIQNLKVKPTDFINILKFQDFLEISTHVSFHHRIAGLVIFIGIAVFLFALFVFFNKSDAANAQDTILTQSAAKELSEAHKMIWRDVLHLDQREPIPEEKKKEAYDRIIEIFNNKLAELEERNKAYFIIEQIVNKAESKSKEVQNRSTLMLVSGLIMAFIGVVVFYFTLPSNISATTDIMKIITLSVWKFRAK